MGQRTFFGEDVRLEQISELGDPLEKLNKHIDWGIFEKALEEIFSKEEKESGGRPPYEHILLFKIAILQTLNNISDDKTEYLIKDRLSFQRFLGLSLDSKVPDAKTIWLFKEKLTKSGSSKRLFEKFNARLYELGLILQKGSIIDATIIEKPRKHKDSYDDGAGWTRKGSDIYYGYKNHVKADKDSKLIIGFRSTGANAADCKEGPKLIDKKDKEVFGDKAYGTDKTIEEILKRNPSADIRIHKKGRRCHLLTEKEEKENALNTPIRVRIEHIFGHMKQAMGGTFIRCKSLARASTQIMLKNLAYNMQRSVFLRDKWVLAV